MRAPTWKAIITAFRKFSDLNKKAPTTVVADSRQLALDLFDCSWQELKLLIDALEDNIEWMDYGIRKNGLARACANPSVLAVMKKLFVLSTPKDLEFFTDGDELSKKAGVTTRGLGWDRSPSIIRIRRNGIMNWGTAGTVYGGLRDSGIDYSDPVVLVPNISLTKNVVFFNDEKLLLRCRAVRKNGYFNSRMLRERNCFWRALWVLAGCVIGQHIEHECFTYTDRVPCKVVSTNRLD